MAIELYDLSVDLRELDFVVDKHPDIVKQIETLMLEAHSAVQYSKFKLNQLGDKSLMCFSGKSEFLIKKI